ncbi:MAG: aminopeptidase [Firmicutes bacterium]|nr:aminopeptidase [Bacillota bacterium]
MNFKTNLKKYAELTLKVGLNLQKGQTLVVNAPLTSANFVRKITKKAYDLGAKNVHVEWNDEELKLIKYKNAPEEAFKEFPEWKAKGFEQMAKDGACFLSISASNPDLLKDVDPKRISTAQKTAAKAMEAFRKYTQNSEVSWAVVSVPTKEWAQKVYPNLNEKESVEKLWESIFSIVRVDKNNPIDEWKKHLSTLKEKVTYLNTKQYKKFHYKAPGTNLTVKLPKNHVWIGGDEANSKGDMFVANMPTEEVFTVPIKHSVNGTVTSTKPLNYGGNLIEDFKLTFEDGKVTDFSAEKGYETLKNLIETDEGSHYLGEVALVPHDSPISKTETIFFNTLFDENASCHFALGSAYPTCVEGGAKMDKDELNENGINVSLTHVDFMIGSEKLDIDAETKDGKIEPIFRNGNWAF